MKLTTFAALAILVGAVAALDIKLQIRRQETTNSTVTNSTVTDETDPKATNSNVTEKTDSPNEEDNTEIMVDLAN